MEKTLINLYVWFYLGYEPFWRCFLESNEYPFDLVEFLEKGHEIFHFRAIPQFGTGTQTEVVRVPVDKTKVVQVPRQSGTGTHLQNRVGIGADKSGIGIDASSSLDFCTFTLLSPKFVHR